MIKSQAFIRTSSRLIEEAVFDLVRQLDDKRVEGEESFTDRLIQRIQDNLDGKVVKGVIWKAKTLKSSKRNEQESKFGADLIASLEIDINGYKVEKGFLAQSKLLEPDAPNRTLDFKRLLDQCKKMLKVSPDSFVFLYSSVGVYVVPAIAILAAGRTNPYEIYYKSLASFFEEYFKSFIGDHRIYKHSIDVLNQVLEKDKTISALSLIARTNDL